jgi:transcriptional regulator with XRE-family HTH domain
MTDYRFIDKDPIIDLIRTAYSQGELELKSLAAEARVHPQTISRWLYGDVKRPQNWTVQKVLRALGVETRYYLVGTKTEIQPIRGIAKKFRRAA